jgi:hypothetical protein
VLTPGDWVHIDYQGRTVVGMIDRLQEGLYTFAYWEGVRGDRGLDHSADQGKGWSAVVGGG